MRSAARKGERVRRLPLITGAMAVAVTTLAMLTSVPSTAATTGPSAAPGSLTASLLAAYAAGRHLPVDAVGTVRNGSLQVASASGRRWATASFLPAAADDASTAAQFQDGAGSAVLTRRPGHGWRLVATGAYGCGRGLPMALRRAWGLGAAAACHPNAASKHTRAAATAGRMSGIAATARSQSLGQRIAKIALSQVGTGDTPVSTDFGLDCNPYSSLVAGFSANANGCGMDAAHRVRNENEEWCADFAKWVWARAGVTADLDTLNAGAGSFYQWALDQHETPQADTGTPATGDAVVFYSPGTITASSYAVHVGLVTAVHPDGRVDMANGDFRGSDNIRVEYDTDIDLTDFAAQIYGAGEQWVLVTPRPAAHPAPVIRMTAPPTAVAGSVARFTAAAHEPAGSITRYYWTFGDGRSANTTGPRVRHVFAGNGVFPVSVTATSSFGTSRTRVRDVGVVGRSSAVAAVPNTAVWFASTPIEQYRFLRSSSGELAVDEWDGAAWLQELAAGQVAAANRPTALAFPDPAVNDATTPHAYFRDAAGVLAQTYLSASGWVTQELAGKPSAHSAIVAAANPDGRVAIFYVTANGRLAETSGQGTSWSTATLTGPRVAEPGTVSLAATATGPTVFYEAARGIVVAAAPGERARPVARRAARSTSLAALTTANGKARVFYDDRTGELTATTVFPRHRFRASATRTLPGTPSGTGLASTNYLVPSPDGPVINGLPTASPAAQVREEVAYVTSRGQPAVTYKASGRWRTAALPGTASDVVGVEADQVADQPSEVILTGAHGDVLDSAATPSGAWAANPLPGSPANFADRVLLYAATDADQQVATNAAAAAGLPASQVTRSYATVWDAVLSGSYLVIAVGPAATSALYYDVCGWDNPSTDVAGSTPFYLASSPLDHLPGADAFENGSAADPSLAQQRATDLAYYAVHGAYPTGVTSAPAAGSVQYACAGSAS